MRGLRQSSRSQRGVARSRYRGIAILLACIILLHSVALVAQAKLPRQLVATQTASKPVAKMQSTLSKRDVERSTEGNVDEQDSAVLIAEVVVRGIEGELQRITYEAIQTRPGRTITKSQLQRDINAIFSTGWFSNVQVTPEDTPLGVRITFEVTPNPPLKNVQLEGSKVIPEDVVQKIFSPQYGRIANFRDLQTGIQELTKYYQDRGFVLAQVVNAEQPQINPDGTVVLQVTEGEIERIQIQFLDKEGNAVDKQGNPIKGVTPVGEILSEIRTKPGEVFSRNKITSDLQRIFKLGIAENVKITLLPAEHDSHKVIVTIEIIGELIKRWNIWTRAAKGALDAVAINNYESAINYYEGVLQLVRLKQARKEEALTLNNLAGVYEQTENYRKALENYNQALLIFQDLDALLPEIISLINIAKLHYKLSQPDEALNTYYQILSILGKINPKTDLLSSLKSELSQSSDDFQAFASGFINLANLLISFNIATTYSILGDYQQAIYVLNDSRLIAAANNLAEAWTAAVKGMVSSNSSLLPSDTAKEYQSAVLQMVPKLAQFLSRSPEIIQPLALKFTASNLGRDSEARDYNQQAQQILVEALEAFKSSISEINSRSPDAYISLAVNLLGFILDDQKTTKKIEDLSRDIVVTLEQKMSKEEFDNFLPYLKSGLPLALGLFTNADNREQALALSTYLLKSWRSMNFSVNEMELDSTQFSPALEAIFRSMKTWVGGIILTMQGNAYSQLNQKQQAIKSYSEVMQLLQVSPQEIQRIQQTFSPSLLRIFRLFEPVLKEIQVVQSSQEGKMRLIQNSIEKMQKLLESNPEIIKQLPQVFSSFTSLSLQVNTLSALGELYADLKDYSKARQAYYQSLLFSTLFGNSPQEAEIRYKLARLEGGLKNLTEAKAQIEAAIEILEGHIPETKNVYDSSGFAFAQLKYGYDFTPSNLSMGVSLSPRGILDTVSTVNQSNPLNAVFGEVCSNLSSYLTCKQKYFDLYINLLMQLHQQQPSKGFDTLAFQASERARAKTVELFRERQDDQTAAQEKNPQQSLATNIYEARYTITQSISFKDTQTLLDRNTLLLEYFLGEEHSYLWTISNTGPVQAYVLPKRSEITKKAWLFYDALSNPNDRDNGPVILRTGEDLSNVIFPPEIVTQLGNKRLLIVGDGILQYIPFNALPDPAYRHNLNLGLLEFDFMHHMKPLLLKHEVVTLPSASTLMKIRQNHQNRPSPAKEIAIFANPVFNHEDERAKTLFTLANLETNSSNSSFLIFPSSREKPIFAQLPGTKDEMQNIAKYAPPDKVTKFVDFEANYKNALSSELSQYRIIHFATHGLFNNRSPERSGIVLSSFDKVGKLQRGLLSPANILRMQLPGSDLVVLSACRSGLNRDVQNEVRGEALTGLTGSLISAGAERVAVSLWSVQDDITAELMDKFYEKMLSSNPTSPAKALTEAQRFMWYKTPWKAPYYWAAFTIQGEWN